MSEALVEEALVIRGATKSFGRVTVLEDVDFVVARGTIHGLLGGNGSGKSTLIKMMAGVYRSDRSATMRTAHGEVDLEQIDPARSRSLGMRFVHQNLGLIPSMSVLENMALGSEFLRKGPQIRWRALAERAREALVRFGLDVDPRMQVDQLRPAEQTIVAVARALADSDGLEHAVLVLDEPTATLPRSEVDMLFAALRKGAEAGQTIILVTHRIDEVRELTDEVTVLRDGEQVAAERTDSFSEDALIERIVGHRVEVAQTETAEVGPVVVALEGISAGPVTDVSFQVSSGEIVGIAGMLGSGRSEILRSLFGDLRGVRGGIRLAGERFHPRTPSEAMRKGVAYLPEDRPGLAALPALSVAENATIADLKRLSKAGRVGTTAVRRRGRELMSEYLVRAADENLQLQYLSGGNQQKVLLARWISRHPRLLLLDEPTQGVDVGAREEIYDIIRRSVGKGAAVILVSSDYDELAQYCHRVLVLRDGRITAELSGSERNAHSIASHVQKEVTC